MSSRIIDLTNKVTPSGNESIPATEQTNPSETTPKNKRFTLNNLKTWVTAESALTYDAYSTTDAPQYFTFTTGVFIVAMLWFPEIPGNQIKVGTDADDDRYLELTNNQNNVTMVYIPANTQIRTEVVGDSGGWERLKFLIFKL